MCVVKPTRSVLWAPIAVLFPLAGCAQGGSGSRPRLTPKLTESGDRASYSGVASELHFAESSSRP